MELCKNRFHMSRQIVQSVAQFTQDADAAIPEGRPGVGSMILKTGEIRIEEIRSLENHVLVRGALDYRILYSDVSEEQSLNSFTGSISFEENVQTQGSLQEDIVNVDGEIDDLSIHIIHSQKLNIRSILTFHITVQRPMEEEIPVDILPSEEAEFRKKPHSMLELVVCRKDIFRVREEMEIPSNLPNAERIVWESVIPGNIEIRPQEGRLLVQGELFVFVLYEAEGEEGILRCYDSTVPFSGAVDCRECMDNFINDTSVRIMHREITLAQDMDGENRVFGIEAAMELSICLYEEKTVKIISDVYGVSKEIVPEMGEGYFKTLICRNEGKFRGLGQLALKDHTIRVLQICHSEGNVRTEEIKMTETGILIEGTVEVQVLFITADDRMPFQSITGDIPFQYLSEVSEKKENCIPQVSVSLDQMTASISGADEIEVRPVLSIHVMVFAESTESKITGLKVSPLDPDKIKELPPMAVCYAQKGDTLWQFGKEYYVPVSRIKEINGLTTDEIHEGDRILIL